MNQKVYRIFLFLFSSFFLLLSVSFSQSSQGPMDGTTFSNVAIAGSKSTMTSLTDAKTSDNNYSSNSTGLASNGDYTDYIQISNFGFTIGSGATIDGITVEIERYQSGAKNVKDNAVRIVKGGTIGSTDKSSSSAWASSDPNTYATYGGSADLWGETWTAADINSTDFGIAISAKAASGNPGNADPRFDHVRITIHFSNLLPVEFTKFTATLNNNKSVKLNWTTASEINNDYFSVEKSVNGLSFSEIGKKKGAGNSSSEKNYEFTDENPVKGVAYYRIKQTDFDGKFDYSDVVAVSYQKNSDGTCVLKVFPNPCPGRCNITLSDCKENESSEIVIEVVDALGNKIQQHLPYRNSDGSFNFYMDETNALVPGIYVVRAVSDKENYNKKVIVK